MEINIPVWLRNRLLSSGLEQVLGQTKKSYIASNFRNFGTSVFNPGAGLLFDKNKTHTNKYCVYC